MTPYDLLVATRRLIADVNRNPLQYPSAQALLLQHLEAVRAELTEYARAPEGDRVEQVAHCGREAPLQALDMVGELSATAIRVLRGANAAGCITVSGGLRPGAARAVLNSLERRGLIDRRGDIGFLITPAGRAVVADADRIGL